MQASTMLNDKTKEIVYMYMCGKQEGWLKFIYWTKRCQTCMSVRAKPNEGNVGRAQIQSTRMASELNEMRETDAGLKWEVTDLMVQFW